MTTYTGNYLTQSDGAAPTGDLTNALGAAMVIQLFSDGAGIAGISAITSVIKRAESVFDAAMTGIYTVPVTPVTEIIKAIVTDIAIYYAFARKPEFTRQDGRNPWHEAYKTALELMKNIRSGQYELGTETAEKPAIVGGQVYGTTTYFIVDPNEGTTGPTGGF